MSFQVIGAPAPQGSKKAFMANGQARMTEASGARHTNWRNDVSEAALKAAEELDGPLDGALKLSVVFRFAMPASRPKKTKALGAALKTTAPDTSKLVRSIEDSMQAAGLIKDDARISVIEATKLEVFDQWTGAAIVIEEIDTIRL